MGASSTPFSWWELGKLVGMGLIAALLTQLIV
jgi:hypothetical protein